MAPREAGVYFTMGKLLKRLQRLDEALAAFNAALDLRPPAQVGTVSFPVVCADRRASCWGWLFCASFVVTCGG